MTATYHTPVPIASSEIASHTDLSPRMLDAKTCLVDITIRRWTGRVQARDIALNTTGRNGDSIQIDASHLTKPCWKLDQHELFKKLDKNASALAEVRTRYGVPIGRGGIDIVPLKAADTMLRDVRQVRMDRLSLARQLVGVWESEVMPALEEQLKDQFNAVRGLLLSMVRRTNAEGLSVTDHTRFVDRFDIVWRPPLAVGALDPDKMDLSNLSDDEATALLNDTRSMYQDHLSDMFGGIMNTVFGEFAEHIGRMTSEHVDPETGQTQPALLDQGKRRHASFVNNIIAMIDRVETFADFSSSELLAAVRAARPMLAGIDIASLNRSAFVREGVRSALQPLESALRNHVEPVVGRGRRSLTL
jgi:hypothetical protein